MNMLPPVSMQKSVLVAGKSASRAHSFVELIAEDLFIGLSGDKTSHPTPIVTIIPRMQTLRQPPISSRRFFDMLTILIFARFVRFIRVLSFGVGFGGKQLSPWPSETPVIKPQDRSNYCTYKRNCYCDCKSGRNEGTDS